ncbi:hypothetical protein MYX04_09935 [Nitrospiraceae bacterium AH_259_D15_M11_P09]|nr:hypothetical protein [Nitrospiraceae bacterium AH_259_D15_M11_P09]
MDLRDILEGIRNEPDEHAVSLGQALELLHSRLETLPTEVGQGEIIDGIRKQFELNPSSDFLEEASWLVNALRFTSSPLSAEEVPIAWDRFQSEHSDIDPLLLDEYPILEGIAGWYFFHRDDPGGDEQVMVCRALAVFEHLAQLVRGHEGDEEYSGLLACNGLTILYCYCGLKEFERARFYAQLLHMEYLAGRLERDDYLQVRRIYKHILTVDKENEEHTRALLELQWQTISEREKRIQELEDQIRKVVAATERHLDLTKVRKELSKTFGPTWEKLHRETKKHMELAVAFSQAPHSTDHPVVPPWAFLKAVNSELRARLFRPAGLLDAAVLERTETKTPASLCIEYARSAPIDPADRDAINKAISGIGNPRLLLSPRNIEKLCTLRRHRNYGEHPGRPYTQDALAELLKTIWLDRWLVEFLKVLHAVR